MFVFETKTDVFHHTHPYSNPNPTQPNPTLPIPHQIFNGLYYEHQLHNQAFIFVLIFVKISDKVWY